MREQSKYSLQLMGLGGKIVPLKAKTLAAAKREANQYKVRGNGTLWLLDGSTKLIAECYGNIEVGYGIWKVVS